MTEYGKSYLEKRHPIVETAPMTTSLRTLASSDLVAHPISAGTLTYFHARIQDRLYDIVVGEFNRKAAAGLTRAELARRLGKKPEQISRWLASPSNWTLSTVSDLLLAISGSELDFSIASLSFSKARNYTGPDWLHSSGTTVPSSTPLISLLPESRPAGALGAKTRFSTPRELVWIKK